MKIFDENKLQFKNFIYAFLILLITFLVFLAIILIKDKKVAEEINREQVVNVSNIKNDNGAQNVERYYTVQNISEEQDDFNINIFYPITKSEVLNNSINNKLNAYIKDIKYVAENSNQIKDASKYTLDISFMAYEGNNDTISFVFWAIANTGWLHPNRTIFTIIYDTKNDKIISQQDLINEYKNFVVIMSEYTHDKLKSNDTIKALGEYDILEEGTKLNKYNFEDIVIDGSDFVVFFETYQVAPYVAGEFEVRVPINIFEKI